MDPGSPRCWEEAAKLATCSIFDFADQARSRMSAGFEELDHHFEGMINSSKFFADGLGAMYWADEWRVLGSIAAGAGMRNSGIFTGSDPRSKNLDISTSASMVHIEEEVDGGHAKNPIFDSWMSRELVTETLIKKQNDYGHNNVARFGRQGLLVRVHDKIARLKNLQQPGKAAKNEAITDTYIDIVGYSAIGIMWERNWFLLDLIG